MMVVMLIMSIALACMAPVMTTKMKADRERALANTSPWNWAQNNTDAYFGLEAMQTAMIGQDTKGAAEDAKLIIHNNDESVRDMILFKHNGDVLGRLRMNGNSLLLGSLTAGTELGTDTIAIGRNINASGNTSVAINGNVSEVNTTAINATASADSSTAIGRSAVASGANSIALGVNSQVQVENSVAIGGTSNVQGAGAVALGWRANASSNHSVSIGYLANSHEHYMSDNGINSIAIGAGAQAQADDTIAIGADTYTGSQAGSIAIGTNVKTGGDGPNIAIGFGAMGERTTYERYGGNNVVIGHQAAPTLTASDNVIIGSNTNGSGESVVIGSNAQGGSRNVVIGNGAKHLSNALLGGGNVTIGYGAQNEANGVLIGDRLTLKDSAAVAIGGSAAGYKAIAIGGTASASYSVAIGGHANEASGRDSIAIGSLTKATATDTIAIGDWAEADSEGAIAIGNNVHARAKNCIIIGHGMSSTVSDTIHLVAANTDVTGTLQLSKSPVISSDRRLKFVDKEFTSGLDKIRQIKPFNYTFKKDETKTPRVGVIAQDLMKIFPNAVTKGADGFFSIRMEDMFYAVINAVKELDSRVSRLEKENKELRARLEKLEAKLK